HFGYALLVAGKIAPQASFNPNGERIMEFRMADALKQVQRQSAVIEPGERPLPISQAEAPQAREAIFGGATDTKRFNNALGYGAVARVVCSSRGREALTPRAEMGGRQP